MRSGHDFNGEAVSEDQLFRKVETIYSSSLNILFIERHDLNSYETHSGTWIAFRQPVQRVARERAGESVQHSYESNPGLVWEEDEFWNELSWQIDPTGKLGVRKHFESPYRPGEKINIDG